MCSSAYYLRRVLLLLYLFGCSFWRIVAQSSEEDTTFLSLKQCIELALRNDLGVKKSALSAEVSRIERTNAYTNLLPSLNFNVNGGNSWGRSIDPTSNSFVEQQIQSMSLGGTSNWVLFQGLRNIYSIQKARIDFDVAEEELDVQRNLSVLSVVTLFLDVLINQELLEQARFQVESTKNQLDRTKRMLEVGEVAELTYLDMRAEQASADAELVRRTNTLNFSLLRLKQALLLPYEVRIALRDEQIDLLSEQPAQSMSTSVASIYEQALVLRPEIRRAELRIRSAELALKIQRGSLFPSLSLSGNLRTNYSSAANRPKNILGDPVTQEIEIGYLANLPTQKVLRSITSPEVIGVEPSAGLETQFADNLSRSLSLNLSMPVFQRWNNVSSIQKARLSYHRARIEAEEVRNKLRSEIEQAYNDLTASMQTYRFAELKWKAAEESFRAAEAGYDIGSLHYTDYRVQSNRLYQARSEWVRSKRIFVFRQKIIEFYLGNLTY